MRHFIHQLSYLDWWLILRLIVSILYWGSLPTAILYYASFYTTTHVQETRRVDFGHYLIDHKIETKHSDPKKRKEEAYVCVLYVVGAILLTAWWFSSTDFN